LSHLGVTKLVRRQSKQKMYYDKSVKFLKPLKTNEKVYIRKDDIYIDLNHQVCNQKTPYSNSQ
jgi:hypothetical protein